MKIQAEPNLELTHPEKIKKNIKTKTSRTHSSSAPSFTSGIPELGNKAVHSFWTILGTLQKIGEGPSAAARRAKRGIFWPPKRGVDAYEPHLRSTLRSRDKIRRTAGDPSSDPFAHDNSGAPPQKKNNNNLWRRQRGPCYAREGCGLKLHQCPLQRFDPHM